MLTYRRLRYATRWNRRLAIALAILLLLAASWRAYWAWQRAQPPTPDNHLITAQCPSPAPLTFQNPRLT